MLTSEDNVFSFKMEKCDKAKKEIKSFQNRKEEINCPYLQMIMIVYVKYFKESTREILGPTCEFSKVAEYMHNV